MSHRGGHRGGRGGGGHHDRDISPPHGGGGGGHGGGGRGRGRGGRGGGTRAGPPAGQGGPKKSLLIGINYTGSEHALEGCQQDVENMREFLSSQGYPDDKHSQLIMRDDNHTDPKGPLWPTGKNMLAAMEWLVSEPGTTNFLHYSGHGGQVADKDGTRVSGFDDTIVPWDYERNGQLPSGKLHKVLVARLPPRSTLFMIFDCCHSGSAAELPFIYRSDEDGNVSMMDNLKEGMRLVGAANNLVQRGFSANSVGDARQLLGGASSFFKGMTNQEEEGLAEQDFADQYDHEKDKNVVMFSGCRDDQTSADAQIKGEHVGAMSWAFLKTMREHGPKQSYVEVLASTRKALKGKYTQVPQLSVQHEVDLDQRIQI